VYHQTLSSSPHSVSVSTSLSLHVCITSEAFPKGPRACIGRKFATVEATCFFALLLRDWKVLPILRDGETKEDWATRTMDARIVLTLGVGDIAVRFVRRNLA
jgi:hypothetical protein